MGRTRSAVGRHVCGVTPSAGVREHLASRWMSDGLAAGAQVVWTEPPSGFVTRSTAASGSPFSAARADGRLQILDVRDVVGVDSAADIPARVAAARERCHHAVAAGFSGLTIGIDVGDALTVIPDVETQLRFEAAWEELTRYHPVSLLCLYGPEQDSSHRDRAVVLHPRELLHPFASARVTGGGICVDGEIDALNAGIFRDFLLAAAAQELPDGDVVIDAGGLSFIDVAGVRVLLELERALAPRRVEVVSPPRALRTVLEVLRWRLDMRSGEEAR